MAERWDGRYFATPGRDLLLGGCGFQASMLGAPGAGVCLRLNLRCDRPFRFGWNILF